MSDENVSAEEARGLLEAATPGPWASGWDVEGDGDDAPLIFSESSKVTADDGKVVFGMWYDGPQTACTQKNAALLAAAPDLARTVIALYARPTEAQIRHDAERSVLLSLWAAIDGEQDGDAPGNRALRDNLVKHVHERFAALCREIAELRAEAEGVTVFEHVAAREAEAAERRRADSAERWRNKAQAERDEQRARADKAERERDEAREVSRKMAANVAELTERRDRFARLLAVERGDEAQAPEGWVRHEWGGDWLWGEVSVRRVDVRNRTTGAWAAHVWVAYGPGRKIGPQRNTALECMEAVLAEEAADAAREGSDV